ncbi:MAG: PHP domain-containing protein [Bacilli bacterium]|nr:PHP domain-containing protein [Bacilli bacterium]
MRADLHVHSSYSDGNMSVDEIKEYAKTKGLSVIAITDHDNLESRYDIERLNDDILLLIGVELSTYHNGENVHILGYFNNNKIITEEVVNYLNELKVNREHRIYEIIAKLKDFYNIIIEYKDIEKFADGALGRVHVAKAISEKYGCTIDEAFDRYIGNSAKAYVQTTNFATKDAIDFLHRNNGIAVMAHPGHIKKNNIEEIVKLGVDGIEVYYPDHNSDDVSKYLETANKYNLLITGGSDFHGINIRADLGTSTINDSDIINLLDKLSIKKGLFI